MISPLVPEGLPWAEASAGQNALPKLSQGLGSVQCGVKGTGPPCCIRAMEQGAQGWGLA